MRGHVRRRGKGWVYVVELPRVEGKRRQEWSPQYVTQAEAEAALSLRLVQVGSGVGTAPVPITLHDYALAWIERRVRLNHIEASTGVAYRERVPRWGALGQMTLRNIRVSHIDAWLWSAVDRWSLQTVSGTFSTLKAVLNDAVKRGLIASSPAEHVVIPRVRPFVGHVWTPEQARYFLNFIDNDRLAATIVTVALGSGARIGELMALRWTDIEIASSVVHIRRTITRSASQRFTMKESTKTAAGNRSIVLDRETMAVLIAHRGSVPNDEYVFQSEVAGSWGAHATWQKRFVKWQRLYNAEYPDDPLPYLRFHDMRHCHATWLIEAGVSLMVVAARMGHSNPRVTLGLYGHLMRDRENAAADIYGALIHGS